MNRQATAQNWVESLQNLFDSLIQAVRDFDWRAWSLLTPAVAYTAGLILYSGEGLFPGVLTMHAARLVGAWLMVAGAEGGTLTAIIEVARKIGIKRAKWYDYAGIVISMAATVFNLLLVWARESTAESWWVAWLLQNGALATILAQVGDFYAGAAFELGLFFSYIREERRADALQDERDALGLYRARLAIEKERIELEAERRALLSPPDNGDTDSLRRQVAELTTALQAANAVIDKMDNAENDTYNGEFTSGELAAALTEIASSTAEPVTLTKGQFIALTGDNRPDNAAGVNAWLVSHGYAEVSPRTAHRWKCDK